jgi:RimJ/RimL family protein N-acetyltransferase
MLIRRTEVSDALDISRLRHDPVVLSGIHTPKVFPSHDVEKWIKSLSDDVWRFTVLDDYIPNPKFMGLVRIDNIDWHNNTCYVGLDIIEEYRGKGLSKKVYNWLYPYLFRSLGMRILYLEVLEDNKLAYNLYLKMGFKECGRFPRKTYNNGRYQDSVICYLDRETWECQKESSLQVEQASADHT